MAERELLSVRVATLQKQVCTYTKNMAKRELLSVRVAALLRNKYVRILKIWQRESCFL